MGLPTRVTLPPSGRPVGGILSAARPIPAGDWWRGVTFASSVCVPPQNVGTCTDGEVTKVPQHLSDAASFDAFAVLVALECSTMGRSGIVEFAASSLDVVREYGVGQELQAGAATGNPSLADADIIGGGAADPVEALACLDATAAQALSGRLAFIHVPPRVATSLLAATAIYKDGRTWYTASGNIVVISPGYDGREPAADSSAPEPSDPLFMYATAEVYAAIGQREQLMATERGQNTLSGIAEDAALVVFDPCFNVAIDSGVLQCAEAGS